MNAQNQLIKNNFNHAALSYLENAAIQHAPALKIIQLLDKYYAVGRVLDLGSGPGTLEHNGLANYPSLSFDLSLNMLKIANTKDKVNGDATNLPFAENSFELIISNLMLQWPSDKLAVLQEAFRVLKPGGKLIISTLINPSLVELQQAWQEIDQQPHTLEFLNHELYLQKFRLSGFKIAESDSWQTTVYFQNLSELLRHFKATGTSLAKSYSNPGLGGRHQLQLLDLAYQRRAESNGLPLTYAYLLLVATKPIYSLVRL